MPRLLCIMDSAMCNRKLLEKQRVQNNSASYEVHIGHFLYNINAAVSFGNRLILSIFRFQNFSLDRQTDRLTDGQNQLLNYPFAHTVGVPYSAQLR